MIHQLIKEQTCEEHKAIESLVDFKLITSSSVAYKKFLTNLLGFYLPVEPHFDFFEEEFTRMDLNLKGIKKTAWLKDDLRYLDVNEYELTHIPQCSQIPSMKSISEVLGVLYVLEGSNLGGQLIYQHIKFLDADKDKSLLKFHFGYGKETGLRWRYFLNILESNKDLDVQVVVQSAKDTFVKLREWFEKNG